jgi:hypothetical protein
MNLLSGRAAAITLRNAILFVLSLLLGVASAHAQAKPAKAAPASCAGEIPFGVKVVRLPDVEQKKVTISDFTVSANNDAVTYDLAMHIKNGSTSWCLTSLAITYVLGDARGQEWIASEYPAVMEFKTHLPVPDDKSKDGKSKLRSLQLHPAAPHGLVRRISSRLSRNKILHGLSTHQSPLACLASVPRGL